MEELLRTWDGEDVIVRYDRHTGAWIVIAIHSTRLGAATGGTRMKVYATLLDAVADALGLARSMTYKFALTDLARGGGKAVIALPGRLDEQARHGLLRRYGALVRQLGGLFETGPDVGTSPADMDIIEETGEPYVHSRTPERGGAGDSAPATALGVFEGIRVSCAWLFGDAALTSRRVVVQGAGSVGRRLLAMLREAGADVLFSDVDAGVVERIGRELRVEAIPPDAVYDMACDVFSPCGLGGVLNEQTIPRLRCRAVVGAANNQLAAPEDAGRLGERGILYAPDFAVNIGGALAIAGMETLGWTAAEAEARVTEAVARSLRRIYDLAAAERMSTTAAAERIAEERVIEAEPRAGPDQPGGNTT